MEKQTTQVPNKANTYSITGVINFFGTLNEKTTTKFDKVERIRFSLSDYKCVNDERMEELKKEFDEQPDTFKPKFVKEECEYINFKSAFEVPVYDTTGVNQIPNDSINSKSHVELIVKVKEGKMYPVAIRLITNASKYNPFAMQTVEKETKYNPFNN